MAEHDNSGNNPGYETTDAHITPLALTGFTMAALMVVSFVSMIVLFKVFAYYQPTFDNPVPPLAAERITNEGARLQIDPPAQKIALNRNIKETLSSYGWIDEQVKVARIPIERAVVLVSKGQFPLINQQGQTAQ